MADLIDRLRADYHSFDFFQAVSLLEEYYAPRSKTADPLSAGRIRFISDDRITFPPNDIAGIKADESAAQLILSFMGLTGASSPLPQYFAEYVFHNGDNSPALRDFLSIFNSRMYAFFYRAWKKYHFMRNFSTRGADPFSHKVAALAGIDIERTSDPDTIRMLAYTGILAGRSRSAAGLKAIIGDFFGPEASGPGSPGHIPIAIQQWMPRWARIPDPPRMGANVQLGVNAIAGTHVMDMSGKFRVVIGPLPREVYETFLPDTSNIAKLKQIVQSYLNDPLEFDIEVQLQSLDLIPVVLGETLARLGATSSLGRSDQKSSIQSIVIE